MDSKALPHTRIVRVTHTQTGGFSLGENSTRVPDWVDENVADWIKLNVAAMDAAWGPAQEVNRSALAFVHIPPCVDLLRLLDRSPQFVNEGVFFNSVMLCKACSRI